jgi:hypothetical protein
MDVERGLPAKKLLAREMYGDGTVFVLKMKAISVHSECNVREGGSPLRLPRDGLERIIAFVSISICSE